MICQNFPITFAAYSLKKTATKFSAPSGVITPKLTDERRCPGTAGRNLNQHENHMTATTRTEVDITIEKQDAARLFNALLEVSTKKVSASEMERNGEDFRRQIQGMVNQAVSLALATVRGNQSR